ncbi:MAG: response regulator [Burkholderiales bacterium]|nr:response regulator [Burkholderiales bacterium]
MSAGAGREGDAAAARRLLILDDDEMLGLLLQTVARLDGLQVRLTAGPEAFYAAYEDWAPTHIVLDLTMPALPGEAVLDELARRGCRARIVIASGAEPQRLADAARRAGERGLTVAGLLAKPFLPAALRALLAGG